MLGNRLRASLVAKPAESDLPKIAGLAALLAMLPSVLGALVQQAGGLRELVPILALVVLVTLAVFAWGVPSALGWAEPGPSQAAIVLLGLGVLTLYCSGPDSRPCSQRAASSSGGRSLTFRRPSPRAGRHQNRRRIDRALRPSFPRRSPVTATPRLERISPRLNRMPSPGRPRPRSVK